MQPLDDVGTVARSVVGILEQDPQHKGAGSNLGEVHSGTHAHVYECAHARVHACAQARMPIMCTQDKRHTNTRGVLAFSIERNLAAHMKMPVRKDSLLCLPGSQPIGCLSTLCPWGLKHQGRLWMSAFHVLRQVSEDMDASTAAMQRQLAEEKEEVTKLWGQLQVPQHVIRHTKTHTTHNLLLSTLGGANQQ